MATEPILEDLEKLMEKCDTDSKNIDGILDSLPLSEEEAIALRYLNLRHTSYEPLGQGLGYGVAYHSFDHLFKTIENEDLRAYQKRYRKALGFPGLEQEYRVQLKLIEDPSFRVKIFDIYKSKVWPIMQQSVA